MIIASISNNTPIKIGKYVKAFIASSDVLQLVAPFGLELLNALSLPCNKPLNINISPIIENDMKEKKDQSIFFF
ncbi:hypothetical protein PAENIP36_15520 [Paenibacillus sp. P36]